MLTFVGGLLASVLALVGASIHTERIVPTPIGVGPAYTLAPSPAIAGAGPCLPARTEVAAAHVELFARGRALLLPIGIGREPGCRFGVWTNEPTGVIHMAGRRSTLGRLFATWGQPLSRHRMAGFASAMPVRVYVAGRRVEADPRSVVLGDHSEVVVELGRYIPPHSFYVFPEGT